MSIFLSATLPLFIYFAIDYYFEFHLAIILTVVYGILEFAFFYIKDKRVDKLILVATVLVVAMGGISYAFDNEAFFKLKPAIMQLFGVAFLAYFIITKQSLFDLMKDRLPEHLRKVDPDKEALMQTMIKHMAILLFLHTFLIVYAAYYMSTASWTFISGVMPYLLMFALMFFEIIHMRKKAVKAFREQQALEAQSQSPQLQINTEKPTDYQKGSIRNRKS